MDLETFKVLQVRVKGFEPLLAGFQNRNVDQATPHPVGGVSKFELHLLHKGCCEYATVRLLVASSRERYLLFTAACLRQPDPLSTEYSSHSHYRLPTYKYVSSHEPCNHSTI